MKALPVTNGLDFFFSLFSLAFGILGLLVELPCFCEPQPLFAFGVLVREISQSKTTYLS
jgi:hypothetical protein